MKERMLTVLVPIKDTDCEANVYVDDADLAEKVPVSSDNINKIYKLSDGTYRRVVRNAAGIYEYQAVVDREFPYLGKPMEIFDFTYDATRMGTAPTLSAQGVMWLAEKDSNWRDITLEDMWTQECHVTFNGENLYLSKIPSSSKDNQDARYKYDLDFVSERVVLENVYIYDVVQPFIAERPLTESSVFSFFGDVTELVKRINSSLLASGLARILFRENIKWKLLSTRPSDWTTNWRSYFAYVDDEYVPLSEIVPEESSPMFVPDTYYAFGHPRLLSDDVTLAAEDQFFSYEEWNSINMGTYSGVLSVKDVYSGVTESFGPGDKPHRNIFVHYNGDYQAYLRNEVYQTDENGDYIIAGYICVLGKDVYGNDVTSEEKLITFDNQYIHDALQKVNEDYKLQYYIVSEKAQDGTYTGNTLIVIADCEHDFADMNAAGTDYERDADGVPVSTHPINYGVDKELLSKTKDNTTDKIVTRITGVGSEENIPWYYPNPTADGWIRPVYKRDGTEDVLEVVTYPTSEGTTVGDNVTYEKYLKNRIGDSFQYGTAQFQLNNANYVSGFVIGGTEYTSHSETNRWDLCYQFEIVGKTKIKNVIQFTNLDNYEHNVTYRLFLEETEITAASNAFVVNGGEGFLQQAGKYSLVVYVNFPNGAPSVVQSVPYYYYPETTCAFGWMSTVPVGALDYALGLLSGIPAFPLVKYMVTRGMGGVQVSYPGFFSTNPNLHFVPHLDLKIQGWYDGAHKIIWEDPSIIIPSQNVSEVYSLTEEKPSDWDTSYTNYFVLDDGDYLPVSGASAPEWEPNTYYKLTEAYEDVVTYAFPGGEGSKTVGVDPVSKIVYGGENLVTYDLTYKSNRTAYLPLKLGKLAQFILDYYTNEGGAHAPKMKAREDDVQIDVETIFNQYMSYSLTGYRHDGWYKNNKKVNLSDYGILNESDLSQDSDTIDEVDSIEFLRVKYITPQPNLMPEVYIRTDGEKRFYNAHNYYPLKAGVADSTIGEEQDGTDITKVINPIYKEEETDPNNKHYVFENEYIQRLPHEHIEPMDDVRPSIKEQYSFYVYPVTAEEFAENPTQYYYYFNNTFNQCTVSSTYSPYVTYYKRTRIDIVEEFAYDALDDDEIWESVEDGSTSGEYKHPFLFAKLRPLGFNLFDLALQEDMVVSMTTGHCGACNFRIGVDENTQKNPVQIWQYDVYRKIGSSYSESPVYRQGELKRYVDTTNLYYKIGSDYVDVRYNTANTVGFLVPDRVSETEYSVADFDANDVATGAVGSLKNKAKIVFEGDVVTRGRFIDSQQDTSENFVWVALYKDTDTYGTIMPSAKPDYGDDVYSRYIEPKGHIYTDRRTGEKTELSDDEADKFVLLNIKMPQVYLRRAERELSRRLVKYMYDNNYQKYNFAIGFSRIFLAQNSSFDGNLNENSVLYIEFNRKVYRQYVKHYSYKMQRDAVLPEISVDLNEEIVLPKSKAERMNEQQTRSLRMAERRINSRIKDSEQKVLKRAVGKNDDTVLVSNNIVNKQSVSSIGALNAVSQVSQKDIVGTQQETVYQKERFSDFVTSANTFNTSVCEHMNQMKATIEKRLLPVADAVQTSSTCPGISKYHFTPETIVPNTQAKFWLTGEGEEQTYNTTTEACPTNQGMTQIVWVNFN